MTTHSSAHWAKRLAELLVVAAAYYVAGRLGLLLAIPPGYATAVWPASGIALAGVLLLGLRIWPGILLGSFAVNVWTSFDTSSAASIAKSILGATSIGIGASLQALVGAFLVGRLVGSPTSLFTGRDVIRWLMLGGPVSCFISPTVGVSSLMAGGLVGWPDYPFQWWTWWVGDTIGVIICAPLALVWMATPAQVSLRRRISMSVPLCLAFAAVVTFFVLSNAWEQDRIELEFGRQTDNLAQTLKKSLDSYVELLHSIESFYAASAHVDRREFRQFVSRLLSRYPGVQALSWNPRVQGPERAAYEERARQDGFGDFQITEQSPQGQLVRAAPRPEYITVYYIEPHAGNERALGFDVASDPIRQQALSRARNTGEPTATDAIILVQETQRRLGLLVFLPIYGRGLPHETVEERRRNLQGYATGVFRLGDVISASLNGVEAKGVRVRLYDETAPERKRLVYDHGSPIRESTRPSVKAKQQPSVLDRVTPFEMAGRRWGLQFALTREDLVRQRSWQAWSVLAGGLLFIGLLAAFLLVVTGRTVQLQTMNSELQREITERKQAEEALAGSKQLLRTIIETEPECVKLVAPDGTLLDMNRAGLTMIEAESVEQVVGKPVEPLVAPGHRPAFRALAEAVFRGQSGQLEFEIVGLKGTRRWLETHAVPLRNQKGETTALLAVTRDITERKRAKAALDQSEAQLRQSQKMEAVGQLAGGIAHDFNNLLTVIRGRAQLLCDKLRSDNPLRLHAQIVDATASRAAGLTQQLLAFSRKQVLQPRVLDLNEVLATTDDLLRRLIGEHITIVADRASILDSVLADHAQLEQVIVNLAVNARDAMPEGGRLVFRTRNVELDEAATRDCPGLRPGQYVMLQVMDTGHGMDAEVQAHLFEPFFTTKGPGKGTGLGLATVYGIIKQSGGYTYVESAAGRGATFTIYLPRVDAMPERKPEAAPGDLPVGSETILVVEDEADVRELIAEILQAHGYRILTASTPREAIEVAGKYPEPIHLLLTDVVMPEMNGRALAESLATTHREMKIAYMTGYTDDAVVHHGVLKSGTLLLPKPFTPAALAGLVREALDEDAGAAPRGQQGADRG